MHYVVPTLADLTPAADGVCSQNGANTSSCWGADDVITTTMSGYDGNWREWIVTYAGDTNSEAGYPLFLESQRVWQVYNPNRNCIFRKSGNSYVDVDTNSCTAHSSRSAFKVLLGDDQVEWTGRFSTD